MFGRKRQATVESVSRASYDRGQPGGYPGGFTTLSPPTPYQFRADMPLSGVPQVGVGNMGFVGAPNGTAPRSLMEFLGGSGGVLVKRQIKPAVGGTGTYIVPPGNTQEIGLEGLTGGLYAVGQLSSQALMSYMQGQPYNGNGPAPQG